MTRQRFYEILREYQVPDERIEILWKTRSGDEINEISLTPGYGHNYFFRTIGALVL